MAPAPDRDLLPRADASQASSASSPNVAAIIGGTVAGLVLLGIIFAVVIVPQYRRRQLRKHQRLNLDPPWESRSVFSASLPSASTMSSDRHRSSEPVKLATAPRTHRHTDSSSSTAPLLGNTMGGSESSGPHTIGHYRPSSQIISSLSSLPYSWTSYTPVTSSREAEEDGNKEELLRMGGYAHLQAPTPTRVTTSARVRDVSPTRDLDATPRPISLQFPSPPRTFPITPPSERSPPIFPPPVEYGLGKNREQVSLSVQDDANPSTPLSPHWTTASTTPRTAEGKDEDLSSLHSPSGSSRSATPTPRLWPTPPVTPTPLKIDTSTGVIPPPRPPPQAVPAGAPVALQPPPSRPPPFPLPVLPPPPLAAGEEIQTPTTPLNFTYFSPSTESVDSASVYSQMTPTDDGMGSFSRKASRRSKRSTTTRSSSLRNSSYPPPSSNPFDIPFDLDALSSLAEHRGRGREHHRLSTGTVRAERSVSLERMDTVAIGNLLKSRATAAFVDLHEAEDGEQSSPVSPIERVGSIREVGERSGLVRS